MQVFKGSSRVVFVFPSRGIAIKLPILHGIKIFGNITYLAKQRRWKALIRNLLYPISNPFGFKYLLLNGVASNWREFWFYQKTRDPFLQPTPFSLFGLLNIQRADLPCSIDHRKLFLQMRILTENEAMKDNHHFDDPRNFCLHEGKLRILDYGSHKTQLIVNRYGEKIYQHFKVEGFSATPGERS